jgi:alkylhydroperoxidase family enzyme
VRADGSSNHGRSLKYAQLIHGCVTNVELPQQARQICDVAVETTRQRGVVSEADVKALKAAGHDNRAVLDVLVLAATKLISNYTNHLAQTPNDAFMKGAEWTAPGKLPPPDRLQ